MFLGVKLMGLRVVCSVAKMFAPNMAAIWVFGVQCPVLVVIMN